MSSYFIQDSPDTRDWPVCTECDEPRNERLVHVGNARLCSTCNEAAMESAWRGETEAAPEGLQLEGMHLETIELEAREPECRCRQTDVDMFDARGCEFHDRNSEWNRRLRAVTTVEQYAAYMPEVA